MEEQTMEFYIIKNSQGRSCKACDHIPAGWLELKGTWAEPKGYKWFYNGKSLFDKDYKQCLVRIQ